MVIWGSFSLFGVPCGFVLGVVGRLLGIIFCLGLVAMHKILNKVEIL
ncbi:MAG: hypothetical protein ACRC3Y_01480 [Romboutsia sp.]